MQIRYEINRNRPGSLKKDGERSFIYPAKVRGFFRSRRTALEALLLAIFFILPILSIKNHPAVFLDIARREFFLFGFRFWATDTPLFFPILATFFCALMMCTALWGRLWCGWACPQTVVIDFIYRRIEEWIEGDSHQRKMLDTEPWGTEKLLKRSTKWLIFALISIFLAHSFLAYFVSWQGWLTRYSTGFKDATPTLVMTVLFSLIFFLDFGWFREQFCIVACPYGRWQSVWLDEHSMVVEYAFWRGEPKRGAAQLGEPQGDCVNCYRCVQSCPTGIDIRQGIQLDCIACTACMDACNEVMRSLGKKPGLIRYTSYAQLRDPKVRENSFRLVGRIRPFLYLVMVGILVGGFILALYLRSPLWVSIRRPPGPLYLSTNSPEGELIITNTLKVALRNQLSSTAKIQLKLSEIPGLSLANSAPDFTLEAGEQRDILLVIKYVSTASSQAQAQAQPPQKFDLRFEVQDQEYRRKSEMNETIQFIHR